MIASPSDDPPGGRAAGHGAAGSGAAGPGAAGPGAAGLERPVRYRGLRFPRDGAILPRQIARQMEATAWQPEFTAAAFGIARSDDRALVLGAGTGHIVTILVGKLGLRHVWLAEEDAVRRAYVSRLAEINGFARLAFVTPDDATACAPTLLFADLTNAAPRLSLTPHTRAVVLNVPDAPAPEDIPFAAFTAAGLAYQPSLSAGPALVFARPETRG